MSAVTTAVGSHKQRDGSKHLVIWLFLLIELFPLYMMLQVSFKDNSSFIQNPWAPTPPYTVTEVIRAFDGDTQGKNPRRLLDRCFHRCQSLARSRRRLPHSAIRPLGL